MKKLSFLSFLFAVLVCSCAQHDFTLQEGRSVTLKGDYRDFTLTGEAFLAPGASGVILFHTDATGKKGYEVALHNGPIDGTLKTGSLTSVRNLYRSLAADSTWFPFEITAITCRWLRDWMLLLCSSGLLIIYIRARALIPSITQVH